MFTPTSRLLPLLLIAGCSSGEAAGEAASQGQETRAQLATGRLETIECALGGATHYTKNCIVERVRSDAGLSLTVRHPDGGFRRFDVLDDGRGLAVSDGAKQARIELADGEIELSVDSDHYRFPASFRSHDATK